MTTSTITLTLAGPMQYWGTQAGPREKRTHPRPTKTAIIGLVANALGRDYTESVDDLAALRFAVTTLNPGHTEIDYKTVGTATYPALPGDILVGSKVTKDNQPQVHSAPAKNVQPGTVKNGTAGAPQAANGNPIIIYEHYLADASFRVALSGETATITAAHAALHAPARPIYLGRRAYSPSIPLVDANAVTAGELEGVADTWHTEAWIEPPTLIPGAEMVADQPISYGHRTRRGLRPQIHRTPETASDPLDFFDLD